MERYVMFQEVGGRRLYVSVFPDVGKGPRFSEDPSQALQLSRLKCRIVEESTPAHLHQELWTPALQELLEEARPPQPILHYAPSITAIGVLTACGNTVHRDSVVTDIDRATCSVCLRRSRGEKPMDTSDIAPKDVPVGYWPIKGKYFHEPIESLPASYWVWVVDKTNLLSESSYLYKYFKDNETTLRRRAKKRL